jgi:hypothetical protein
MPNCYRCDKAIDQGQASRRKEEVRQTVSSDGKRETHYSNEFVCKRCVYWEIARYGSVILGGLALAWFFETIDLRSLVSLEARSQETIAVGSVAPKIDTKPRLIPPEKPDDPTIFYRWPNR